MENRPQPSASDNRDLSHVTAADVVYAIADAIFNYERTLYREGHPRIPLRAMTEAVQQHWHGAALSVISELQPEHWEMLTPARWESA